ncbi:hypothetical protein, partial [Roseiconus lacunae]|uniref:hypothetical protein n=1 Tax=Roseiconus lacunae TaxID=2605694 RepID=UPI001F18BDC9
TVGFSGAARTTHHFKDVNSRPPLQPMVPRGFGSTVQFGLLYARYEGNEMSEDNHRFNSE